MDPLQQHAPSSDKSHFAALEQALADSKSREQETRKQLDTLINVFLNLEKLILEQKQPPPPTLLKNPENTTLVQTSPSGPPPPLVLPSEFDGDQTQGQEFLKSCQTYICLSPDLFPSVRGLIISPILWYA